jgi:AraC-like DNA-binding protein
MVTKIIHPRLALSGHVKYFWSVEVDTLKDNVFSINTFVDDSSGIIFFKPKEKVALVNKGQTLLNAFLYGQTMIPSETLCVGSFKALGVLFYPHAIYELFDIPASNLTNMTIQLTDFLTEAWVDAVMESECPQHQIKLISDLLVTRLSMIRSEDRLIKHSLAKIKLLHGLITVNDLCNFYNLSERQFERRFQAVVGVSPRHYIKVTRFQEGISRIRSGKYKKLSQIAHELHYADQSHFVRHIRELSGINPKTFRTHPDIGVINLMVENEA